MQQTKRTCKIYKAIEKLTVYRCKQVVNEILKEFQKESSNTFDMFSLLLADAFTYIVLRLISSV